MRRRYYIVAVCLLVMSFLLTACGGKEKDKKVIHIQIAYENNTDEPLSKACEKWKELLEEKRAAWDDMSIEEHFNMYVSQGMDKKDAMKLVAKDRGVSKRDIYNALLD